MKNLFDVFISYGRADSKAFATQLHQRLTEQGFNVWFDQNDIPLGVDFQEQIYDGIEKAHNFLFIIAPHSVKSAYCLKEILWAVKHNKRIIPLLHVEPKDCWDKMHPTIGKINWVYFREEQDNFETGFTGLINLMQRHADYVEQHTQFLVKALEWEQQQKRTSCLLIGEERQQAESWLKRHFKDEQPPCLPTNLHCEFITESIKNANNLMTQVFLSYADEDRAMMEKIRNSLRRESITIWTNKSDIQTGEAFEEAIERGIEQADNLVYLLSPNSVNCSYCQRELDYAFSLHKRIIPVLVQTTNPEQVPNMLRSLQYIDLTDNVQEEDYHLDESQLLNILHQDAAYYNEHKILLTKALKWKRQHCNPSILLRGYNLRHAEAWLKVAQSRTRHPPTPLQEEFINESLRQPPAESLAVFISYSRADSDFARKLNDALQIQGKTTWFDQESIASGSDFQQEIYRGIKACDNFLFILSPRSVKSPYCASEVEYAASLNKRFVTVLHRQVNSLDLHPELAKVQWIDFNQNEQDFNANFNQLVRTLDTDREHVHSHTKWLQRAIEWEQNGNSKDLLLRGSEFAIAQNWLQETEKQNKRPAATPLQEDFIVESGEAIAAELKKEKRQVILLWSLLGLVSMGFLVSAGLGMLAFHKSQKARENQQKAEKREIAALIATSEARLANGQPFQSLLSGLRAAKKLKSTDWIANNNELRAKIVTLLQQSLYQVKERNTLEDHDSGIADVHFSADGQTIATIGEDKTVNLWRRDGKLLSSQTLNNSENLKGSATFSPDGQTIAAMTKNKTIKLWRRDGTLISTLQDKQGLSESWTFSRDGQTIATSSIDNKIIQLWQRDGHPISTFKDDEEFELSRNDRLCHFSSDGQTIATISYDETIKQYIVKLWRRDGTLMTTLKAHDKWIQDIRFSPDAQIVATASQDETVKLWRRDGTPIATLPGNDKSIQDVTFSSNGQMLAAAGADDTVQLWRPNGTLISTLKGHEGDILDITFSPNSQLVATASADKTVKLWQLNGTLITTLTGHSDFVKKVNFTPDSKMLVSFSDDNTVKLWTPNNDLIRSIELNDATIVHSQSWSRERGWTWGQTFATSVKNGPVKLWKIDGTPIKTLLEKSEGDVNVSFLNKGQTLVTTSNNKKSYGSVQLWKANGTRIATLLEKSKGKGSVGVSVSSEGQTIATSINTEESYGPVQLWNANGSRIARLIEKINGKGSVEVSVSKNGQAIVTAIDDEESYGPVQLWKVDGTLIATLIEKSKRKGDVSVTFNNDGRTIKTSIFNEKSNGSVRLWQANGTPLATLVNQDESQELVTFLKFSNDDRAFVTINRDENLNGFVKLWKADGTLLSTLIETSQEFVGVRFSNDSQTLVTSVIDGSVQVWKTDGTLIATAIEKSKGYTQIMSFSPDNKTVALLNEKAIALWSVDGTTINIPTGHKSEISTVLFSPDGQTIASASYDNTVKLWKRDGTLISTLTDHKAGVSDLMFSADGKTLTSVDSKNLIVRRLDGMTNLDDLMVKGCQWMTLHLRTSRNLEEDDKHLCDEVGTRK